MAIIKEDEIRRIGRRLAEIRKEKGMSQGDVAAMTGLQQTHISRIERGIYNPGVSTLAQIADAMGARIEVVIHDADASDMVEKV